MKLLSMRFLFAFAIFLGFLAEDLARAEVSVTFGDHALVGAELANAATITARVNDAFGCVSPAPAFSGYFSFDNPQILRPTMFDLKIRYAGGKYAVWQSDFILPLHGDGLRSIVSAARMNGDFTAANSWSLQSDCIGQISKATPSSPTEINLSPDEMRFWYRLASDSHGNVSCDEGQSPMRGSIAYDQPFDQGLPRQATIHLWLNGGAEVVIRQLVVLSSAKPPEGRAKPSEGYRSYANLYILCK